MGLLQVALACIWPSPEVGGLLAAYLVCGLGALAGHYLAAGRSEAAGPEGGQPRGAWGLARFAWFLGLWTALVGAGALCLFLVTPRLRVSDWQPWRDFGGLRVASRSVAGSIEGVDLNRTGWVLTGTDPAFTFHATTDSPGGQPATNLSAELRWELNADMARKVDSQVAVTELPTEIRWRGTIMEAYERGRWFQRVRPRPAYTLTILEQFALPELGRGQTYLTVEVRPKEAGGLFLAEPIHLSGPVGGPRVPEVTLEPVGRVNLFAERAGTVLHTGYRQSLEYRYVQVLPPRRSPQDPAVLRNRTGPLEPGYWPFLLPNPLPQLKPWTARLLRRLATDPKLFHKVASGPAYDLAGVLRPGADDDSEQLLQDGDSWEPAARALCDYLAHSGEYTYTLELVRAQPGLDPILDFLFNTKQGHCERYASALVLMLRSQGIPARLVKGYKGLEHQGGGTYVVRQSQVHAWAEALVPSRVGRNEPEGYDWLTLDPTPDIGQTVPPMSLQQLWNDSQRGLTFFWEERIVNYNSERRAETMLWLRTHGRTWAPVVGVAAAVLAGSWILLMLLRRRRRQPGLSRPTLSFYGRLLELLARHRGLTPATGQTPREFAGAAAAVLGTQPATAAWAGLPSRVVELYYRARFGDRPLDSAEGQALGAGLDELAAALRSAPRPVNP
jgi:transglutaminase-like putative cysteine protease